MTKTKKLGLTLLSTSILSGCCVGFATSCNKKEETKETTDYSQIEANKYEFKDKVGEQTKKLLDSEVNSISEAESKLKEKAITENIIGLKDGEEQDEQYILHIKSVQIKDYDFSEDQSTITIKRILFQVYASKDDKETTIVELNSGDEELNFVINFVNKPKVEALKYEFKTAKKEKIASLLDLQANTKSDVENIIKENAVKEGILDTKTGDAKYKKDEHYTLNIEKVEATYDVDNEKVGTISRLIFTVFAVHKDKISPAITYIKIDSGVIDIKFYTKDKSQYEINKIDFLEGYEQKIIDLLDLKLSDRAKCKQELEKYAIEKGVIGAKKGQTLDSGFAFNLKNANLDIEDLYYTWKIKKITIDVYLTKNGQEVAKKTLEKSTNILIDDINKPKVEAEKYDFKDNDGSIIRSLINNKKYFTDEEVQNAIKNAINNDKNYCGIIGLKQGQTKDERFTLKVDSVSIKQETHESKDGENISKYGKVSEITIVVDVVRNGTLIKVGKSFNQKLSFTYFYDCSIFMYMNKKGSSSKTFNENQFYFFDNKDIGVKNFKNAYKNYIDLSVNKLSSQEKFTVLEFLEDRDDVNWASKGEVWVFDNQRGTAGIKQKIGDKHISIYVVGQDWWTRGFWVIRRMNGSRGWGYEGQLFVFKNKDAVDHYAKRSGSRLGIDFEIWKKP